MAHDAVGNPVQCVQSEKPYLRIVQKLIIVICCADLRAGDLSAAHNSDWLVSTDKMQGTGDLFERTKVRLGASDHLMSFIYFSVKGPS